MVKPVGIFSGDMENLLEDVVSSDPAPTKNFSVIEAPCYKLVPGPWQVRKDFCQESIEELAVSIREHGILQPLVVRIDEKADDFQIIAGERRWRAASLAGLDTVPVIVKDLSDEQCLALCLIENIQRENLNLIEEGEAYSQLICGLGMTHQEVADRVGKSRAHITNLMRVLNLSDHIKELIKTEKISYGHAKLLMSQGASNNQEQIADMVVNHGMSIRELEQELKRPNLKFTSDPAEVARRYESHIKAALGINTKVGLTRKKVTISLQSEEDLKELIGYIDRAGNNKPE